MLLGGFCTDTANVWQILGLIVNIVKIVIPVILIVLGMVDLGKAVVSSDDKAIGKAVGALIKRFIAAVVLFFIPTIVSAIFGALNIMTDTKDYNVCIQCVTNANGELCSDVQPCAKGSYDDGSCTIAIQKHNL